MARPGREARAAPGQVLDRAGGRPGREAIMVAALGALRRKRKARHEAGPEFVADIGAWLVPESHNSQRPCPCGGNENGLDRASLCRSRGEGGGCSGAKATRACKMQQPSCKNVRNRARSAEHVEDREPYENEDLRCSAVLDAALCGISSLEYANYVSRLGPTL